MADVTIQGTECLDKLLMSDPEMEKKVTAIVKTVIRNARNRLSKEARSGLQMKGDPRNAYKAVKSTVYRKLLGGNVSILQRKRGKHTQQMKGYEGADRGFILRFLNDGTKDRQAIHMNGRKIQRTERPGGKREYKSGRYGAIGFRGKITARRWFGNASETQMEQAAKEFEQMVSELIAETFNKQ